MRKIAIYTVKFQLMQNHSTTIYFKRYRVERFQTQPMRPFVFM